MSFPYWHNLLQNHLIKEDEGNNFLINCDNGGYLYPAVNFIYQCPSGFARHNGACIPIQFIQAKPGQPCHSMTECTGGAVCVGGICRCLPGLFPSQGVCILPPAYMYG
ncbi:EB module family protein [Trichuris trichiura]|uniref:EB module family protein n=1 Tax=Trichuris trichiura TaxID=36087 RepID=A0A077Z1J7_TRITR|nr:EB module family protein [Trichuris trichiura]